MYNYDSCLCLADCGVVFFFRQDDRVDVALRGPEPGPLALSPDELHGLQGAAAGRAWASLSH